MSVALATIPADELGDLARTANAEHHDVVRAGASMLEHAIRAGMALNAAREIVQAGGWMEWVETNFDGSLVTANCYRRMATHVQLLREQEGVLTIEAAHHFLRKVVGRSLDDVEEDRQEARKLKAAGMSTKQVAEHFGVDRSTAARWLQVGCGKYAARRRRAVAAAPRRRAVANLALVLARFKAAAEAQRAGDIPGLASALEELAAAALDCAERLRSGTVRI